MDYLPKISKLKHYLSDLIPYDKSNLDFDKEYSDHYIM